MLPKERVLWIADHSGHYEPTFRHAHSFMRMLAQDSEQKDLFAELGAHKSPLVDTVYFGNSDNSRALQIADVSVLHNHNAPPERPQSRAVFFTS